MQEEDNPYEELEETGFDFEQTPAPGPLPKVHFHDADADYAAELDAREGLVAVQQGCPRCSERHLDSLVWDDLGEHVKCQNCGTIYQPPAYLEP